MGVRDLAVFTMQKGFGRVVLTRDDTLRIVVPGGQVEVGIEWLDDLVSSLLEVRAALGREGVDG